MATPAATTRDHDRHHEEHHIGTVVALRPQSPAVSRAADQSGPSTRSARSPSCSTCP
ncbi:hypothetical protein ACFQZ4_53130 [Catellatospora coxensis]